MDSIDCEACDVCGTVYNLEQGYMLAGPHGDVLRYYCSGKCLLQAFT